MGEIIIPGFPTGMLAPGIYINVELGRQPPSAAGLVRRVLLIGRNPGGPGPTETIPGKPYRIYRLRSNDPETPENDKGSAEGLFGRDEDDPTQTKLFWMAKAALDANPLVPLYAIKVVATTPEYADVLSTTTGTVKNQRFHYIVVDDPGQGNTLSTYLDEMAAPLIGYRQQGIIASHAVTVPSVTSLRKSPRLQYAWSPQGAPDIDLFKQGKYYYEWMLASAVAAVRARHESVDPAVNLCLEKAPGVPTPPPENAATKETLNNSAITKGITPLVTQGTSTVILRSVTTAADPELNTYPVLDTTKTTVTDFVADDIELKMLNRYTGFKLAPDTDLPPPSRTATPKGIKNSLLEWLREHEKAGRITLVSDLAERVLVEIDEETPGRVNFQIPEDVIEIFAVAAGNLIQIG